MRKPSHTHGFLVHKITNQSHRSFCFCLLRTAAVGDDRVESGLEDLVHSGEHRARVIKDISGHKSVIEDLLDDELSEGRLLILDHHHLDEDGMVGVNGELLLGDGDLITEETLSVHHLHHLTHAGALVINDEGRIGGDLIAESDGGDLVAESVLDELDELGTLRLHLSLLGRIRGVLSGRLSRNELASAVVTEVLHDEVIERVVEEEHLVAGGLESLIVGGSEGDATVRSAEEIDVLLARGHAGDVIIEGDITLLTFRHSGAIEAEEAGKFSLVREVRADTFLDEGAELVVPLVILVGILLRLFLEVLDDALGEHRGDTRDEERVLHVLTRDVKRHIFRVNHTLNEAEVIREEALSLALDEHLTRIERGTRIHATHTILLHVTLREVEQGVDLKRHVRIEVHAVGGGIISVGDVAVELGVLLLGDLVLGEVPDSLNGVHTHTVEVDGVTHEVRVLLEDGLHSAASSEVGSVLAEVDDDLGTSVDALGLAHLVGAGAVRHPVLTGRRVAVWTEKRYGHRCERRMKGEGGEVWD